MGFRCQNLKDMLSDDVKTILRKGLIDNVAMHTMFKVYDKNLPSSSMGISNFLPCKILDQTK